MRRRAFTLTELLISVAIVLVLMLGINYVFSTSAKTISTGMAVTGVTREHRGARKVFEQDFRNAVKPEEMPALIIHNEAVYAWRDKQDKLTDADADPSTYDVDGVAGDEIAMNGFDPASWGLPGIYNFRRHRVDRISFFASNGTDPYARQTGDENTYRGPQTAPDAWIQYGMLRLPDNGGTVYWKPGARGTPVVDEQGNHNNFFATQWAIGRRVMLLRNLETLPTGTRFITVNNTPASALGLNIGALTNLPRENPPYPTAAPWKVEESRLDLVGVQAFGTATGTPLQRMSARVAAFGNFATDGDVNRDRRTYTDTQAGVTLNYLAWAKPFVNKSGFANSITHQTRETALTTPVFLRGATQFIVEFAGDFYDQSGTGTETGGTNDFEMVDGAQKMRWYGLPRDADGDGTMDVRPFVGAGAWPAPPTQQPRWNAGTFESAPATGTRIYAWGPITAGMTEPVAGKPANGLEPAVTFTPGHANYVRPSLVRIVINLTDPQGRLLEGQTISQVFRLPGNQ
jgi:prepilin-type N-terminal cleavage/methylation domain-containing protein